MLPYTAPHPGPLPQERGYASLYHRGRVRCPQMPARVHLGMRSSFFS